MDLLSSPLFMILATAAANGLVTYGVVKTTLRHHAEGIAEAKSSAASAHDRIDNLLLVERERA